MEALRGFSDSLTDLAEASRLVLPQNPAVLMTTWLCQEGLARTTSMFSEVPQFPSVPFITLTLQEWLEENEEWADAAAIDPQEAWDPNLEPCKNAKLLEKVTAKLARLRHHPLLLRRTLTTVWCCRALLLQLGGRGRLELRREFQSRL